MPFIRDNGRKAPETLDEFTAYLRWVRDNDVNKNGNRNDEIPLAFARDDIKNAISFIAKAYFPFVNTDQYFGLGLINGKVTEQYRAGEYRDALRYLAGLYKEGLILPDSFTMNREQLRALGENPGAPILATALCAAQNSAAAGGGERWLETFLLPVMKGPTGRQYGPNKDPWSIISVSMFITDKCKNPDAAVALYDYLINTDVMLDGNNGPKGVAWAEPDPGASSLMGGTPVFKALITYGTAPVNSSWYGVSPLIGNTAYRLGEQAKDADIAKQWLESGDPSLKARLLPNQSYNEMMNYITTTAQFPYEIPASYFIPPLAMNEIDGARLADINATLNTYKEQAAVEFIVGSRDINNNTVWTAYLADLDRLGSAELAGIMQKYIKK
jgi:putative aldouronate transport system substrate-binding protein